MLISQLLQRKGGNVATVLPSTSIAEAVAALAAHRVGALVVSADGAVLDGILSERDIVRGLAAHGLSTMDLSSSDLMTADVVTCSKEATTEQLMAEMTARRIRHVPVTEDGSLVGIVSIGDVVNARVRELETEAEQLNNYITGR
jgi:CBS domain-containing protein